MKRYTFGISKSRPSDGEPARQHPADRTDPHAAPWNADTLLEHGARASFGPYRRGVAADQACMLRASTSRRSGSTPRPSVSSTMRRSSLRPSFWPMPRSMSSRERHPRRAGSVLDPRPRDLVARHRGGDRHPGLDLHARLLRPVPRARREAAWSRHALQRVTSRRRSRRSYAGDGGGRERATISASATTSPSAPCPGQSRG